eukprot:SAG31_NODE_5185_length_2693_cov_8.272938_3_plen_105_part_01
MGMLFIYFPGRDAPSKKAGDGSNSHGYQQDKDHSVWHSSELSWFPSRSTRTAFSLPPDMQVVDAKCDGMGGREALRTRSRSKRELIRDTSLQVEKPQSPRAPEHQ